MKLVISAKVRINLPLQEAKDLFTEYNNSCNTLSQLIFFNKNKYNHFDLHKLYYQFLLDSSKLSSQFVCSILKTVTAKYKSMKSNGVTPETPIVFKNEPVGYSPGRNLDIIDNEVSIKTLEKRVKCNLTPYPHFNQLRETHKIGGCSLFIKDKKVYLSVSFNREQELSLDNQCLGVDLGIKNIATISNGSKINKIYKATKVAKGKQRYKQIKSSLQSQKAQKKSRSLRRKQKRFQRKERNFVRNSNHIISKDIVTLAKANNITLIKMEDLTSIRNQSCSKDHRKALHSWSYYELQSFIEYKANAEGISAMYIDPSYTSQSCNKCGIIDPLSRCGLNFKCIGCNYKLHADMNASRNIMLREEVLIKGRKPISAKKSRTPRKAKPKTSQPAKA